jgi:hypothetical protein
VNDLLKHLLASLCLAATLTTAAAPASASEYCDIKQTPDGFIALRAQPGAKARLVARMKAGDAVMFDNTVDARNGWTYVLWWKGGRASGATVRGLDTVNGKGWVNQMLLGDECG